MPSISFIMPAYNCVTTIGESVASIMEGNFQKGDEVIIVNDHSTDTTENVLNDLKLRYCGISVIKHLQNKGGGAARNTAVENAHNQIIFCLDSDNILVPGSIEKLKRFMIDAGADVAAFREVHFFKEKKDQITHAWEFKAGSVTLADYLAGGRVPGASGNYMFTKESWVRAAGYPEFTFLDTWGFGLRQVATGSIMVTLSDSYYLHRYGHDSYWVREDKKGKTSVEAWQVLMPFSELLDNRDIDFIMSRTGQTTWFNGQDRRPIRVKSGEVGRNGIEFKLKGAITRRGFCNFFNHLFIIRQK